MVNVGEELAGRELDFIVERRRFGDDEAAISQLCEAWLVARINFDNSSLITDVVIIGLTYETHFGEGSRECINHRLVVDWKSIHSIIINT